MGCFCKKKKKHNARQTSLTEVSDAHVESSEPDEVEQLDSVQVQPNRNHRALDTICCWVHLAKEGKLMLLGDGTVKVDKKSRALIYGFMFGMIIAISITGGTQQRTRDTVPDEPSASQAVVTGALGLTLGPCLILYGFKINDLLVVLNALISCGLYEFMDTMFALKDKVSGHDVCSQRQGEWAPSAVVTPDPCTY
jgi:hypothetical protein